jgi:hypothetical protein
MDAAFLVFWLVAAESGSWRLAVLNACRSLSRDRLVVRAHLAHIYGK